MKGGGGCEVGPGPGPGHGRALGLLLVPIVHQLHEVTSSSNAIWQKIVRHLKFRFFSKISEIVSFDRNSVLKNFSWVFRDLIKETVFAEISTEESREWISINCSSLDLKNIFFEAKLCQYCDQGQGQFLTNAGDQSHRD